VAVLVIGVVLAVALGGGDDGGQTTAQPAPQNEVTPPANQDGGETNASSPTSRGDTTVAVLNGTTIPGLARRTGDRVETSGFTLGTVTDAPVQNRSATIVQYAEGSQDEARQVAEVIGVGEDAVSQLDVSTRTVAGEQAEVVVTVGADQDQGAGRSG
jgi:LytR cell envelope-related transcriptional attenuator